MKKQEGIIDPDRAILFYAAVLVLSTLWLLVIFMVPFWMEGSPLNRIAAGWITWFFSPICHQIPERSFKLTGHPLVVCARCAGIYSGFLFGAVLYPFVRKIGDRKAPSVRFLLAAFMPAVSEWILVQLRVMESSNLIRGITGFILGGAVVYWIYPAVFQIAGNINPIGKSTKIFNHSAG